MNESNMQLTEEVAFPEDLALEEAEALLSQQLEDAFAELELSEDERKQIGDPDSLGKVMQDEVWKQVSAQLGLELTNETLIQKYDREHFETYGDVSKKVMQDPAYKDANKQMREKQQAGTLEDAYTGKNLGPADSANLDHTVSRKEIYENQRRKQAGLSTEELANKPENLNPTNESLNKSKREKSVDDYVETRDAREQALKKQNEKAKEKIDASDMSDVDKKAAKEKADKRLQDKLAADGEKMKDADQMARTAIKKEIAKGAVKQTAKKAGADALKTMAVSALMDLLKEITNRFIRFLKEKAKSFKLFLEEMKAAIKSFFSKILTLVKTGATSVLGTIVTEVFGPIVSLFRKLASFIKQGISSFIDAVRFLSDKENRKFPFAIRVAQVGKIVVSGLVGAGGIALSGVIEAALRSTPIGAVEIPLLGSLSGIVGVFLASLISGLIGAIVLNLIDKFIARKLREESTKRIIGRKNEILGLQELRVRVAGRRAENARGSSLRTIAENHAIARELMRRSAEAVFGEQDADIVAQLEEEAARPDASNESAFAYMQKELANLL